MPEISVALNSFMPPIFCLIEISIGTDPIISITAKRVNITVTSSLKLNGIAADLCKGIVPGKQVAGLMLKVFIQSRNNEYYPGNFLTDHLLVTTHYSPPTYTLT